MWVGGVGGWMEGGPLSSSSCGALDKGPPSIQPPSTACDDELGGWQERSAQVCLTTEPDPPVDCCHVANTRAISKAEPLW